jgi:hypothetical protein
MSLYTYEPGKIQINFGIPNIDLAAIGLPTSLATYVTIKDWVSLTSNKPNQKFSMRRGVWGESFLEYKADSSRVFNLSILQTSDQVVLLRGILELQEYGLVGVPFSIVDTSSLNIPDGLLPNVDINNLRQKSGYPVGVIRDEPIESWALDGAVWNYQIVVAYGQTIYL